MPTTQRAGAASAIPLRRKRRRRHHDARPICRIDLHIVGDMSLLNCLRHVANLPDPVVERRVPLRRLHIEGQVTPLLALDRRRRDVPIRGRSVEFERRLIELKLVGLHALAVPRVRRRAAEIALDAYRAAAVIAVDRTFRRIQRQMTEVDAKPIALCIHRAKAAVPARPRHDIHRRKRSRLDLHEEAVRTRSTGTRPLFIPWSSRTG